MKQKLALLTVLTVALGAIWFSGCTTANPNYNPNQPPSANNQQFLPDPRINSVSNSVAGAAQALSPLNPYAGITNYALSGIFGAIGLVSGIYARVKSGQATTANAALDTMAAGVVKAGSTAAQAVLDHASTVNDAHFAVISQAINNNTGANQTITGAAKT